MADYTELVKSLRESAANKRLMTYAADAITELEAAVNKLLHITNDLETEVEHLERERRWIPVVERLPENDIHVLLCCKHGVSSYVCDGFHTEKYSTPTNFYDDIDADYDEETDEYYFPEGWWEVIKNWDDFSCVAIEDAVTHWMPLPQLAEEG